MKRILIILLLTIPFVGFGQLYSIPENLIDYDIIPNGVMESCYTDKFTHIQSTSESIMYYTNLRPKEIEWTVGVDLPLFMNTTVLFHENGKIKSIYLWTGFQDYTEKTDSIFYNFDGSVKKGNQSRFINGKNKYEVLGNYLFHMSRLDSMSKINDKKLIVLSELDKLLNTYYQVLRKDMENKELEDLGNSNSSKSWKYNSKSFSELKKSQYEWLNQRGDLITKNPVGIEDDLGKINNQIKLYQIRLYLLRNQMSLLFHEHHLQ